MRVIPYLAMLCVAAAVGIPATSEAQSGGPLVDPELRDRAPARPAVSRTVLPRPPVRALLAPLASGRAVPPVPLASRERGLSAHEDYRLPMSQERRLPVYDDDGEIIPFEEIEALVDPSGLNGGFWGGLTGALLGGIVGGLFTRCGGVEGGFQHYCSPQEESLQTNVPFGLALTFGVLGAWWGHDADQTTFDEAVARIRYERRVGR